MLQEALSLLGANWVELVLGLLLLVSEVLGSSEKFSSSSVFQLIVSFLKSKKN